MAHQGEGVGEEDVDVVKLDLKRLNLYEDLAQDRLEWRNKIHVADPT